jgi:hypothetical protein
LTVNQRAGGNRQIEHLVVFVPHQFAKRFAVQLHAPGLLHVLLPQAKGHFARILLRLKAQFQVARLRLPRKRGPLAERAAAKVNQSRLKRRPL